MDWHTFCSVNEVAYIDHVRAFLEAQAQCGVPSTFASSNVSILNLFYYTLSKILLKPVATSFSKETLQGIRTVNSL